jgi:hypothetical protein
MPLGILLESKEGPLFQKGMKVWGGGPILVGLKCRYSCRVWLEKEKIFLSGWGLRDHASCSKIWRRFWRGQERWWLQSLGQQPCCPTPESIFQAARVIWRPTPHVGRWSQSDWGLEQKHTARAGQGREGQGSTAPRIKKKWRKPRVPEIWSGECYHQARSVGEKRYLGQHQFITENCPSPNPHNKCLSRGRKYPSCI